jgi:hypothetical protein
MRDRLCPRCGCTRHEVIAEGEMRCQDCGHLSYFVTAGGGEVRKATPEELAESKALLEEAADRMHRDMCRATFCGHALDERWTGLRWLGATALTDDGMGSFELAHGDSPWDEESPEVRVTTRIPAEGRSLDDVWRGHAAGLVHRLWEQTRQLRDDVRRTAFPRSRSPDVDPTAPWQDASMPIDGVATAFRVLGEGTCWVAQARHAGVLVAITARAWPVDRTGLVMVPVVDLARYRAGTMEMHLRWPPPS